ncbi:MAG: Clp protease N-terminal domain-containing protein [Geminicoccaceae bacterium]
MAAARLSLAAQRAIARSLELAREHGQPPGTLHLLAALLDEPDAREALEACAVDPGALRAELARSLAPAAAPAAELEPDEHHRRTVRRALIHVEASGLGSVRSVHLLSSLVGGQDPPAAGLLAGFGVSRLDVALYLAHGTRKARP